MSKILVEVRPKVQGSGNLAPATPRFEDLSQRLDEIADTLTELSTGIAARLGEEDRKSSKGGYSIDEIELKLSLDLESKVGVVISGTASAGFEASLKWKRRNA